MPETQDPSPHLPVQSSNAKIRTICEICSTLKIRTLEKGQTTSMYHSGVHIVNFEPNSHIFSAVYIFDNEQVNIGWNKVEIKLMLCLFY